MRTDADRFDLRTLGTLALTSGEGSCVALLAQPKRLALLVYLAMSTQRGFQRRDTLLPLFWPEQDGERARAALRQAARFLRTTLSPDVIETRGAGELRVLPGAVQVDTLAFRAAAAAGDYLAALDLYHGNFLAGFFVANAAQELEDWIARERAELLRIAVECVTALASQHEEADRLDDAVRVIRRGISLDPLDEPLHRQLMILLDAVGDRAGALEAYELLAQRLARELDAMPSTETRTLRDRIHKRGASQRDASPRDTSTRGDLARGDSPRATGEPARSTPQRPPTVSDQGRAVQSLVLLPFAGRQPHEATLGAGMTEMLHALLKGIPDIELAPVASDAMAALLRSDHGARQRLGGAVLLLDGDIALDNDGIVVNTRLLSGATGEVRWHQRFALPAREVFALQDSISRAVASALNVRLAQGDEPRLQRPTHDLEAYNLYLRGRWHWTRRPRETRRALEYLEQAIARDPLFALAHAAIADCYNTLGSWEASELPSWEAFPRAHAAAQKALELSPSLAEGRTAIAYAEMHYTWRRDVAESQLRQALATAPTYGHGHHWHSHLLIAAGRVAESLEASELALRCDPIDPVLNVHLAWHHWLAREPGEAIAQCARTLELHPGDHWSPFFAGLAELLRQRPGAAIESLRVSVDRSSQSVVMRSALAHALAVAGHEVEARRLLAPLETTAQERRVLSYEVALVHAALGERDEAFAWLDRAYEERSAWLAYAAVEPRLDCLRGDERFVTLMQALRLPAAVVSGRT